VSARRKSGFQVSWTTITYRSVALVILAIALLCGIISYFLFPQPTTKAMEAAGEFFTGIINKLAGTQPANKTSIGAQQAHFTNLDGTVRVKRSNSNVWIAGDYSTPLEKGDVVQTGSEGMAKIVFADGSNYTVKQDSLIVVEDNSVNANQQTRVAVEVTTGTVDLTTATFSEGSKSQVTIDGNVFRGFEEPGNDSRRDGVFHAGEFRTGTQRSPRRPSRDPAEEGFRRSRS
jgi:hypothetical protein